MAEENNIIISVTADDSGAINKIEKLGQSINAAGETSQSLRVQLKSLQTQLANTDPNSAKYRELAAAAGDLKDKIQDAAQAVGTQAGGAFERVSGSLGLVTGRLQSLDFEGAAEGAKLFAKNISEVKPGDITKGVQGIGSAFVSVGRALLTNPIFLIGAAIAAAVVYADELLSLVDGVSSAEAERLEAQKESAAASKETLDAVGQQENILKLQGKTEKEILQIKIAKAKQAIIDQEAVIQTLEIQRQQQIEAAERNRDILKGLLNFISAPLIAVLAGVDLLTSSLNQAGLLSDETFGKIGNLRDKFTTSIAELVFNPADVAKEGDATLKEAKKTLDNLKNQQAGFELSIQQIDKSANDKRKAEANKNAEERLKNEQDIQAELAKAREQQLQSTLTAEEKELRQVSLKYEQLKTKAGENAELQKQLREQELIELQAISDRYFDAELVKLAEQEAKRIEIERAAAAQANINRINREDSFFKIDRELEYKRIEEKNGIIQANREKAVDDLVSEYEEKFAIANGNAEREKALQEQQKRDLARINSKYRTEQNDADQKSNAERVANFLGASDAIAKTAQDGLNTLVSLNEAFAGKSEQSQKKAFQRNKALQIAQTSVNTYQSATSAYASQIIPGDPTSIPRAVIAAAAAVAAGLANIAKIKATTFSSPAPSGGNNSTGGGGGDLASQGVASSGIPQFNPLAGLNLNQPQQIQPAYVLASDIASSMEARSKVEDLSRL